MENKTNIILVCEGNRHRSKVAEYLLIENLGIFGRRRFNISSAGINVLWDGVQEGSWDKNVVELLNKKGIKVNGDTGARQLLAPNLLEQDLILTFNSNLERRLKMFVKKSDLSQTNEKVSSIANYLQKPGEYDLENPNELIQYTECDSAMFRVGRATWRRPFQRYVHPNDDKLIVKMYGKYLYKPLEKQMRLVAKKLKKDF
ncbi:MAG: hypothetical protein KC550_03875 [Nanoarchaeota archaeon]|nr:hypothetical protein [Nanoarchaeota archaeon]